MVIVPANTGKNNSNNNAAQIISYEVFAFVLMGWSLLPNALQPFKIYCAPQNLGIRT